MGLDGSRVPPGVCLSEMTLRQSGGWEVHNMLSVTTQHLDSYLISHQRKKNSSVEETMPQFSLCVEKTHDILSLLRVRQEPIVKKVLYLGSRLIPQSSSLVFPGDLLPSFLLGS